MCRREAGCVGKLDTSGRASPKSPGTSGCCIDRWCSGSLRKGLVGPVLVPRGGGGRMELGSISHAAHRPQPPCGSPSGHLLYFGGLVLRGQLWSLNLVCQIPNPLPGFVSLGRREAPSHLQLGRGLFSGSPHVALPFLWDPEMRSSAPPEGALGAGTGLLPPPTCPKKAMVINKGHN